MMDGQFRFYTVEEISVPRSSLVSVYRDCWWPTTEDGRVAVYFWNRKYESPQCNVNYNIADAIRIAENLTGPVIQIPIAFANHICEF